MTSRGPKSSGSQIEQTVGEIISDFDAWLATQVIRRNLKHDELPQLNDAFRDYFKNTRTARIAKDE